MSGIFYKVLPHIKPCFYPLREQQMAEIRELQRLYELFKVAKGHIDGIDVMLDGRAGPVDDSFRAWAYYFGRYPKKWRTFQFKRFGIA